MNDLLRCISASSRHWANTLKPWWEPASRYWGSCKMLIKALKDGLGLDLALIG